jgi:hypothetical protein
MEGASLRALNPRYVSPEDQTKVLQILQSARTPGILFQQARDSKERLSTKWQDTMRLAEKMERIRQDLGLPEENP